MLSSKPQVISNEILRESSEGKLWHTHPQADWGSSSDVRGKNTNPGGSAFSNRRRNKLQRVRLVLWKGCAGS